MQAASNSGGPAVTVTLDQSNRLSGKAHTPITNRNKPLPLPGDQGARLKDSKDTSTLPAPVPMTIPIPALSVSPDVDLNERESNVIDKDTQYIINSRSNSSNSSSTTNRSSGSPGVEHIGDVEAGNPASSIQHRSSLRSIFNRSSMLFRSASSLSPYSRSASPAPSHSSDASLPLRNEASTSHTHLPVHSPGSSDQSHCSTGSSVPDARRANHLQPRPAPTTTSSTQTHISSSFSFGRSSSSRLSALTSETDHRPLTPSKQRRAHSKQGIAQTPFSSSSTSSVNSTAPASRTVKGKTETENEQHTSSLSKRFSQHLSTMSSDRRESTSNSGSRTSGYFSYKPVTDKQDDREATVARAIAEASRKAKYERPSITRLKSRSMENLGAELHPEALKSLAIGTVSVVEMEKGLSAQQRQGRSGVAESNKEDTGQDIHRSTGEANVKQPNVSWSTACHPKQEVEELKAIQDSAFMRFAGSLRRSAHRPTDRRAQAEVDAGASVSKAALSSKHKRHRSLSSLHVSSPKLQAAQVIQEHGKPEERPPVLPPKDHINLSSDAWWDAAKMPLQSKSPRIGAAEEAQAQGCLINEFEAAHLAAAISAGDSTVEARMSAAAESPKAAKMPVNVLEEASEASIETKARMLTYTQQDTEQVASEQAEVQQTSVLNNRQDEAMDDTKPADISNSRPASRTHKRSLSLQKVIEPFVGKVRSRSGTMGVVPDLTSVSPMILPSASPEALSQTAPAVQQRREGSVGRCDANGGRLSKHASLSQPPSSYNALRLSKMLPKSESDPLMLSKREKSQRDTMEETRNRSYESSPASAPPRSSSMAVALRTRKSSSPTLSNHIKLRDDLGKTKRPELSVDIPYINKIQRTEVARPSSAMGMSAHLERNAQRKIDRQPTLSIVDDMEFLQALEQVRKLNQERIQRQQREAESREALRKKRKEAQSMNAGSSERRTSSFSSMHTSGTDESLHRTSNCVGAASQDDTDSAMADSPISARTASSASSIGTPKHAATLRPSALELGVGKASGKLRDGAFLNDEDWKKEVKALFIIRELVLTERSYARHLESLLQAVRAINTVTPPRRSTTPSLMMSPSNALTTRNADLQRPLPQYITFLRNLLPQLITLSRTLANQIDDNPTAAGVGAAFRLVSCQMEATFVTWSSAIRDVMDALRANEAPKAKTKTRIGLITIESSFTQHRTPKALSSMPMQKSGFVSVPTSPVRRNAPLAKNYDLPSVFSESPTAATFEQAIEPTSGSEHAAMAIRSGEEAILNVGGTMSPIRAAKRRSTISSVSPSLAFSLRSKLASSMNSNASSNAASATSSPTYGRASISTRKYSVGEGKPGHGSGPYPFGDEKSGSREQLDQEGARISSPSSTSTNVRRSMLTAMDIAIMPTQRVPRYLLLLRDLHANTPPQSLSNARVQRSLDFLHRIASDCDRVSKSNVQRTTRSSGSSQHQHNNNNNLSTTTSITINNNNKNTTHNRSKSMIRN